MSNDISDVIETDFYQYLENKYSLIKQWSYCFILNCVDYCITRYYLTLVGNEGEANPIQHWNLVHFGAPSMLVYKMICLIVFGGLLLIVRKQAYGWIIKALKFLNVLFGLVIVWSLFCVWSAL
jgi:hypothetical protein